MDIEIKVMPIRGSANYFVGVDESEKKKYSVWMESYPDKETFFLSRHRTFEIARKISNRWQLKENNSVLKNGVI